MIKVEESAAIPEAGRKIPESEPLPCADDEERLSQPADGKGLMTVEIALVHALQYLAAKSDNS